MFADRQMGRWDMGSENGSQETGHGDMRRWISNTEHGALAREARGHGAQKGATAVGDGYVRNNDEPEQRTTNNEQRNDANKDTKTQSEAEAEAEAGPTIVHDGMKWVG